MKKFVAAAIVLAVMLSFAACREKGVIPGGKTVTPGTLSQYDPEKCRASYADRLVAQAVYPVSPQYPDGTVTDKEAEEWVKFRKNRMDAASAIDSSALGSFVKKTVREYLASDDGGNRVYSPVSLEIALSMLAEITDGQTRAQILSLLGADSIENARRQAVSIWDGTYRDDGIGTTVLADSLWLNDGLMYKKPVLDILADSYRASSFSGKPGSTEYDSALRGWLTEQTRGMLDTSGVKLDPRTVIALAQTVYYKVSWNDFFRESDTGKRDFEGTKGRVSVDFMNREIENGSVYFGDGWQATRLDTSDGGAMWLILPDKGRTTADVIASDGMFDLISGNKNGIENRRAKVRLSVPKFDVSSLTDLIQGLINLGVTDAFGSSADFSPLTDIPNVFVSEAKQAARVVIDEKGCTGAAYTLIVATYNECPGEKETIDFILDRQFVFAVTSDNGIPLFVGAVNDLTA